MKVPSLPISRIQPNTHTIDLSGKRGVVLFWADWCGYCQAYKPTFEKLYKSLKTTNIYAVHCPDHQEVCSAFGISSYPTLAFVDEQGNVLETPPTSREDLEGIKAWLSNKRRGTPEKKQRRSSQSGGGGSSPYCSGKTVTGEKCHRYHMAGRKRCWQHTTKK